MSRGGGGQDLSGFSMLDLFRTEVDTQATILNEGLIALESDPKAREHLEALMRAAHSIKGAARIVEMDVAVKLAHAMEDCFVAAQDGKIVLDPDSVDVLLQAVDLLTKIAGVDEGGMEAWLSEHSGEIHGLMASMDDIKSGHKPASAVVAPPSPLQTSVSFQSSESVILTAPTLDVPSPQPPLSPPSTPASSQLVSRGGGGQDLSGFSMLDLFRTEVDTQATILNEGLMALEGNPLARDLLEGLMRAAHSIKGAARIVEMDVAVKLAHAMEDCFVAAQDGKIVLDPDSVDVLLQAVDLLAKIAGVDEGGMEAWLSEHSGEIHGFMASMGDIKSGHKPAPAVVAPPVPPSSAPEPGDADRVETGMASAGELRPPALPSFRQAGVGGPVSESVIQAAPPPQPPSSPPPTPASSQVVDSRGRVVRVTAESLNRLMELAGESLVETRWLRPFSESLLHLKRTQARLFSVLDRLREVSFQERLSLESITQLTDDARQLANECRRLLSDRLNEFEMYARRSAGISDRLYREAISSRMRPFADGAQAFPRMVRDLARELGKKVRFEIVGKSTEVDRDILEKLEAPVNHLLRNALDHGLESPQERASAGKPPEGLLRLEARHRAGMLFITVSDDGRGVDLERLRSKIVARDMVSADMASDLRPAELLEFLFLPGFSTAERVSEISGRGVGLDIVHSMVQEVGGSVRATSQLGKGMACHLQLPLTLSVIRGLLVEIAGEPYAFPLARIDRTLMIPTADVDVVENHQYFTLDGQPVGLVPAHEVLELTPPSLRAEHLAVVVASDRLNRYGLQVDRFLGERNLVVRPLDPRLGKLPDISAASLMEDGSPILIIDVDDMVRSIDNLLSGGRLGKVSLDGTAVEQGGRKRVLVVDDSITVREVERKLLDNRGYQVEVAVDGMDGWNAVRTTRYDLVISDVDMPRMNGIELVRRIKQDPVLKGIPVMIVSYKDSEEDRLKGLDAGANYYLTKSSFHDETLLNAVIDLIGESET